MSSMMDFTAHRPMHAKQRGSMLLEALIGLLIFAIGALAMVALQATSLAVQTDAQSRIEASNLAQRMLSEITVNVNRTDTTTIATSLAAFVHQATTAASDPCAFSGTASTNAAVTDWATAVNTTATTRLPGATSAMQQIKVTTADFNRVDITLCWQAPSDTVKRRHTLTAYIN
jgi:type IV pilus assembly protein PilV